MARKKKKEKSRSYVKIIFIIIVVAALIGGAIYGVIVFLNNSEYFDVNTIKIDSSLQFIHKADLASMKGKNIFEIDLKEKQRQLEIKYPQVRDLKIVKRFPNQILVVAKKRKPFVQTELKKTVLTLDDSGVVLSTSSKSNKKLPQIIGLNKRSDFTLGKPLGGISVQVALKIIRQIDENQKNFASVYVSDVDVSDLSKIVFHLTNDLEVIIDQDKVEHRIRVLGVILAQNTLELNKVKYVDLRFKEPIVGKK